MLRIGIVVLGVSDIQRATRFWREALRYVPRDRELAPGDDWIVLIPSEGEGTALGLGISESAVQEHPRMHFDVHVANAEEQSAEVERLVSLGAERVAWDLYPDSPDFIVLADPEGNRFCVVDESYKS
jgi:catechol 2,3-dioxygenase-like lactoylglutathione lyase family enzyme